MTEDAAPKRKPVGRPRKTPEMREANRFGLVRPVRMKQRPNWDDPEMSEHESADRLRIDPALIPEGMSLQWVTTQVFGQDVPQHRSRFEKRGWTPVHQDDFDGQLDGLFMPKGHEGEITVDGLVLMARPKQMTDRARRAEKAAALQQVSIREQAWKSGDLKNVSLDSQHPSAVNSNRINRTMERIVVPDDE